MSAIDPGIIRTKLQPPSLPAGVVARPRLLDRLDGPERLVAVTAPAGFGKTVLVVDWLGRAGRPFGWLSLDSLDTDPHRFFGHLAAAVERLGVDGAEEAAAKLRPLAGHPAGTVPWGAQEALEALGAEPVIVLDDLHELEGPVLEVLRVLLEELQGGPRVILLSRVDPPLPLGRLRLEGELLDIRERDLRFTLDESTRLLESLVPESLDRSLVERLETRTEGWVAGLRMAAIALQQGEDLGRLVDSFGGDHRFVIDYLVEEAVSRQDEALQRFLMDTSLLARFTVDACEAVTGDPEARARLREAEEANLFLFDLGDGWYRYHHLFAELLRFRLRRVDPERVHVVNRRASRWFEAQGDIHQALEHACRLPDDGRTVELLDRHGLTILGRSELGAVSRWLACVTEPLSRPYPVFLACIGWHRTITERAPDLAPVLRAADAAIAAVPEGYPADQAERARIELDILRAFAARFAGRLEEAVERSRRVLDSVPEEDAFSRGRLLYNEGRVRCELADMPNARELLERAFDENLRAGTHYLVLTGLAQAANVTLQTEGVHRALDALESAVQFAADRGLDDLPAFAAILFELGHVHWVADAPGRAETHLRRAIATGGAGGLPEGRANGLVHLARVQAGRRSFEEAGELLTEAAALAHSRNVILRDTTIELEKVRLALLAEQWGAGPPVPEVAVPEEAGPWTTAAETRVVLALTQAVRADRTGRARTLAGRLESESEPRERGVALTTARLARVLLTEDDDRWSGLEAVLDAAGARGYIRPFLEFGEPVRQLLQAGLERTLSGPARAHARRVVDAFDRLKDTAAAPPPPELVEPLTDREYDVLEHLFDGLSNKAIARAMFISTETVKTHLKHVYGKLGVSNREDAVARARELGLRTGD